MTVAVQAVEEGAIVYMDGRAVGNVTEVIREGDGSIHLAADISGLWPQIENWSIAE